MNSHVAANPDCAWCGRRGKVTAHHLVPVHVDPLRAADPTNLISLCSADCHIVVGHFRDWTRWNTLAAVVCAQAKAGRVEAARASFTVVGNKTTGEEK